MAMYFHCKLCGQEHRARIQMPRMTFESPTTVIKKSLTACPTTGQVTGCDKEQMFWKDETASTHAA
ncbi:MAG: hypothetical protein LC745_11620 [Planctomycetia bacterium]|nr:hypothetical protein [Planctomycetia bacterium]